MIIAANSCKLIFTSNWFWFVTFIMSYKYYKPKPVTCKNELGNYRSRLTISLWQHWHPQIMHTHYRVQTCHKLLQSWNISEFDLLGLGGGLYTGFPCSSRSSPMLPWWVLAISSASGLTLGFGWWPSSDHLLIIAWRGATYPGSAGIGLIIFTWKWIVQDFNNIFFKITQLKTS